MNSDQIGGIIRALVTFAGGYFAAKGIGNAELWTTLGGALATVLATGWSMYTNRAGVEIKPAA